MHKLKWHLPQTFSKWFKSNLFLLTWYAAIKYCYYINRPKLFPLTFYVKGNGKISDIWHFFLHCFLTLVEMQHPLVFIYFTEKKKKKYIQIITDVQNAIQNIFCNSIQYSVQDFGKNTSLAFLIITESLRVKFPHATEIPIALKQHEAR